MVQWAGTCGEILPILRLSLGRLYRAAVFIFLKKDFEQVSIYLFR